MASWRNGYAADCKSVYTGSIPVLASIQKFDKCILQTNSVTRIVLYLDCKT